MSDPLNDLVSFPPLPIEPTTADMHKRRDEIRHARGILKRLEDRLRAESAYLQKICPHKGRYSSNWCGRDPGGGGCKDCGACW